MKRIKIAIFVMTMAMFGCAMSAADLNEMRRGPSYDAEVVRVIDGNTVVVRFNYERPSGCSPIETVKLAGVDAQWRRYGYSANESDAYMLLSRMEGDEVMIEADGRNDRDRRGSLVGFVWYGGECVNRSIIRKGFGRVDEYSLDAGRRRLFLEDEKRARRERKGLWFEDYATNYDRY